MSPVIVDCTELYQNPVRSGIQRVVRQMLRHWPPDGPELQVARFDSSRGLVRLSPRTIRLLADQEPGAAEMPHAMLVRCLQESSEEPTDGSLPEEAITFVPELFYDAARCRFYIDRLAAQRGRVALLAYDFLPYLRPDIFRIPTANPLMAYLRLARLAPHVAYISEQTRRDHARRVLRSDGGGRGPVLPLGSDGLQLERQTWRPDRRTFVALGSLDGRKNQQMIVAAFIELWRSRWDIPLTIIGRAFDGLDLRWMEEARGFRQFRWLSAANDQEVKEELRHARATIFVSDVEGFGIPPIESLDAGIPVIVSATVPSVAMLQPAGQIRLDQLRPTAIAEAVLDLMQDDTAERLWAEAASLRLSSWRDFGASVGAWLASLSGERIYPDLAAPHQTRGSFE